MRGTPNYPALREYHMILSIPVSRGEEISESKLNCKRNFAHLKFMLL